MMKSKPEFKLKEPEFSDKKISVSHTVEFSDLVFDSTSQLLEYIKNSVPENAFQIQFVGGGFFDTCWLSFNTPETWTDYYVRYDKFLSDLSAWKDAMKKHEESVKAWEDLQRQNKKIKDARYNDPEYIEYLRLKAKMKEKGLEG